MFEKKISPLESSSEVFFESLLTWPIWIQFLEISGIFELIFLCACYSLLAFVEEHFTSEESRDFFLSLMARGKAEVKDYVEKLVSGEITVKQLQRAKKNRETLLELCKAVDLRSCDSLENRARKALADRSIELKAFREKENVVKNFVSACRAQGNGEPQKFVSYFFHVFL